MWNYPLLLNSALCAVKGVWSSQVLLWLSIILLLTGLFFFLLSFIFESVVMKNAERDSRVFARPVRRHLQQLIELAQDQIPPPTVFKLCQKTYDSSLQSTSENTPEEWCRKLEATQQQRLLARTCRATKKINLLSFGNKQSRWPFIAAIRGGCWLLVMLFGDVCSWLWCFLLEEDVMQFDSVKFFTELAKCGPGLRVLYSHIT